MHKLRTLLINFTKCVASFWSLLRRPFLLQNTGSARRLDDGELDDEEVLLLMHENQHRNLHANLPYEKYRTRSTVQYVKIRCQGRAVVITLIVYYQFFFNKTLILYGKNHKKVKGNQPNSFAYRT